MVTYEETLEIAKEWKDQIDNCTEYENAYVFGFSGDSNYIGGYGHTPAVVMKEDGTVTNMPEFIAYGGGEEIRSVSI